MQSLIRNGRAQVCTYCELKPFRVWPAATEGTNLCGDQRKGRRVTRSSREMVMMRMVVVYCSLHTSKGINRKENRSS